MQDWWQATFPKGQQTVQIVDANDRPVMIAYGEKGTGQPLFLAHGIASWSYCWHRTVDALAEHFRVICFDAKNSGFSDKPTQAEKPGHKIVEMARVIQALSSEPAIVVAESLGALISLGLVQQFPALVDRLVLINVPIFPKRLPNWGMQLLSEVPIDWLDWIDQARLPQLLAPIVRQVVYGLRTEVVSDPAHITPENVYWKTYPHLHFSHTLTKLAEEFQLSAQEIRQLEQGEPNLIQSIQDDLGCVTCPTLILWSEFDRWFPASDGERLRDRLPQAQFKLIPNCGHYAAGAQPEFVNAAILEFLQDCDPFSTSGESLISS